MRLGIYKRIYLLILIFPFSALALPVSNLRNEASGVIFNKLNRSFAENDPIWKFTGQGLGDVAAGLLSGASYRSFAAALPLLGIAFMSGWDAGEQIADYFLEKNGYKAKYQAPAIVPGGGFYECTYQADGGKYTTVQGGDVRPVIVECDVKRLAYIMKLSPDYHWTQGSCDFASSGNIAAICDFNGFYNDSPVYDNVQASYRGPRDEPDKYCDVNEIFISGSGCVNVSNLNQPEFKYDDLAGQQKNDGIYDKPSNPALDADFINGLWKGASGLADYQGVPYTDDNKITESDINNWRQQHPDFVPDAGEYADYIPDDSGAAFPVPSPNPSHDSDIPTPTPTPTPIPDPDPSPSPDPSPDIHVDVHVDFGPDPHIPSPDLPDIPTGKQIVEPLWNMFPALHDFKLTTRDVVCPTPEFHLFDRDMKMDAQCVIAEKNRAAFSHISMFFWVVIAALIILSA